LLISIFILLLISVVAISLIVASGTESALTGNYRSSTGVYYAALAGLEETRGRLASKNANSFRNTAPGFLPSHGSPFSVGFIYYVLNPSPTENSATLLATYPDTEYDNEFGGGTLAAATGAGNVSTTPSVWNISPLNGLSAAPPLYKWVRINAVSEKSLQLDVSPIDGTLDPVTPVYYDVSQPSPLQLNISGNGVEVLEITSLAVLPNGSQKILQYLVATSSVFLPSFPAAITLLGNNVDYTGPNQTSWNVSGNDTIDLGSCNHNSFSPAYAIGYYNGVDASRTSITGSGAVATMPYKAHYTGQAPSPPSVGNISGSISSSFQKPSQLDALAQAIAQAQIADVVITGPATGSSLPVGMSPTNLMTVVVNGDLDLTGWHNTGYGLLLVTGNLTYDPDASWYGIVFLIGQGYMTGSHSGSGQIVGGLFLAKTRDTSGILFPDPNLPSTNGTPGTYGSNIQFDLAMGGQGIYYSSCWIKAAKPTSSYTVLAFHEISQ
jgi:hypothetical protein